MVAIDRNNYIYPTDKVGYQGSKSVNPFGSSYQPEVQKIPPVERQLDPNMLAAKRASSEVGMGGTGTLTESGNPELGQNIWGVA